MFGIFLDSLSSVSPNLCLLYFAVDHIHVRERAKKEALQISLKVILWFNYGFCKIHNAPKKDFHVKLDFREKTNCTALFYFASVIPGTTFVDFDRSSFLSVFGNFYSNCLAVAVILWQGIFLYG